MAKKSSKLKEVSLIFKDNDISKETIELDDEMIQNLIKIAKTVPEYRNESYVRHLLSDVIMITFFAVLSGSDEWNKIEIFAKSKEKWLRKYLELPNGIPTDDTFRLIIGSIKSEQFYSMVVSLLIHTVDEILLSTGITEGDFEPDIVAVDGKESNASGRKESLHGVVKNLRTLNVYSSSYGICLAQSFIDEKTNEIPAAQEVLRCMDLKDCIVTADALNCQRETVSVIRSSKGDYVLALKGNQPLFYEEVVGYFTEEVEENLRNAEGHYFKTIEKEHGGIAIREYFMTDDTGWYADKKLWKDLNSFGMVKKRLTKKTGETIEEIRYCISNLPVDARQFERAARGHWGVENNLHWQLDVTFKDDKNTSMSKTGAKNLQIMKKIVMSLLKIVKESYKMSMANIRYMISLNFEEEVEKLMSLLSVKSIKQALE